MNSGSLSRLFQNRLLAQFTATTFQRERARVMRHDAKQRFRKKRPLLNQVPATSAADMKPGVSYQPIRTTHSRHEKIISPHRVSKLTCPLCPCKRGGATGFRVSIALAICPTVSLYLSSDLFRGLGWLVYSTVFSGLSERTTHLLLSQANQPSNLQIS